MWKKTKTYVAQRNDINFVKKKLAYTKFKEFRAFANWYAFPNETTIERNVSTMKEMQLKALSLEILICGNIRRKKNITCAKTIFTLIESLIIFY